MPTTTFDLWATAHIYGASAPRALIYVMVAVTALGSTWSMLALIPFLVRRKTRRAAAFLLASFIVALGVVYIAKHIVQRPRPFAAMPGISVLVVPTPSSSSFPSGHATKAFTAATFLVLVHRASERFRRRILKAGLLLLAAAVGLSRIFLGVHFPTDVVAGALVGCATGFLGAAMLRNSFSPRPVQRC